jgi:pimeloyl-ACP methyl ester carboxylesterase
VAEYVELRGIRTWYDVHGVGEPLLLVHPGGVGVDSRAFGPNVPQLSEAFRVYTPDRRGHGRTPDVDGPITYEAMAADTIEFIERIVGAATRVLGMYHERSGGLRFGRFRRRGSTTVRAP